MANLKPCPFCGETQFIDIYGIYDQNGDEIGSHITCGGCMAHFRVEDAVNRDEVIAGWNRRAEGIPPQPEETVECIMCGETLTEDDLTELRDMGEQYHHEKGCFLCPDCWDCFRRMDPEEQIKMAVVNGWKEVAHDYE
ncbi:MAG: Lar family restriction alleviation protein [Clostridia bacterium]|nr:Lar family restriction alleviation protein [Clostridia bacterium]